MEKRKEYVPLYPVEFSWQCPECKGVSYAFPDRADEEKEKCFYCGKEVRVKRYWKM
jgi:hypothetical protein